MARRSLMIMGFASVMVLLCCCSCVSSSMAAAVAEPAPAPEPELVTFVVPAPKTYNVGDGVGWRLTTDDPNYWRNWTESKVFYVGDVLRFEYDPKYHNVVQIEGDEGHVVESLCNHNLDNADVTVYSSGNDSVTLEKPGFYGFVSEFDEDCINGLHIVLQVHSKTPLTGDQDRLFHHYYYPHPVYYVPHHHHHGYYYWSSSSAASVSAYLILGMLTIYKLLLLN